VTDTATVSATTTTQVAPLDAALDARPAPVSLLADIVSAAEDATSADGIMDITLLVHGAIISGRIIGEAAYLDLMADQWKRDPHDAASTGWIDSLVGTWKARSSAWLRDERPISIHLRDAEVMVGQTSIELGRPGLWRTPLREVGGFTFGRVSCG
jgi:hypothetical protein